MPLSPDLAFGTANPLALAGWIALAVSPPGRRWTPRVWQVTGWWLPLALAVLYVALFVGHHDPSSGGGFGSIAEVQRLFEQPGVLVAGWVHYLAFDLFVGTWIAREGAARGVRHLWLVPCFALTFLFGPAGLLAFAILLALHRRSAT